MSTFNIVPPELTAHKVWCCLAHGILAWQHKAGCPRASRRLLQASMLNNMSLLPLALSSLKAVCLVQALAEPAVEGMHVPRPAGAVCAPYCTPAYSTAMARQEGGQLRRAVSNRPQGLYKLSAARLHFRLCRRCQVQEGTACKLDETGEDRGSVSLRQQPVFPPFSHTPTGDNRSLVVF